MAEQHQNDWSPFSVGKPSTRANWVEPDCQPLTTVEHVTHTRAAIEIIRHGALSPSLIFDESRLNRDRILVVWLSPNDWSNAGGFRYGNVAFAVDWVSLVDGMNAYWVGAMPYRPKACRILITDQDRDDQLKRYDPRTGTGPWWFDAADDVHYWNGQYCLEFMLECELTLAEMNGLRFVGHHDKRCCIDPTGCPDRGDRDYQGGGRFLAACCGEGIELPARLLTVEKGRSRQPTRQLRTAWEGILHLIDKLPTTYASTVSDKSPEGRALTRAALATLGRRDQSNAATLLGLLPSREAAIAACADVVEADLGLPKVLDRG